LRRNCDLKHVKARRIEEWIEVTGRQGRSKQLLYYLNPLKTKRRLLNLKTQIVPRRKHFSSKL